LGALGSNKDRFGGALKKAKSTEDVLLGAVALYGSGQHAEAKETVKNYQQPRCVYRSTHGDHPTAF